MNKAIAHILKEQLAGLPVIDKIAGLVQTAEYEETTYDDEGVTKKTIIKKIPITTDGPDNVCKDKSLVPDSSNKGMIYFEDIGGITFLRTNGSYSRYRSRLRMVCWFNGKGVAQSLEGDYNDDYNEDYGGGNVPTYDVASILINHVVNRFVELNAQNKGKYLRLQVGIDNIPIMGKQLFSAYTYDMYNTQYLMYPYEYFAIDLNIEFEMHKSCIESIQFIEQTC